jgi:site-specific DNA-methyltransferase (adenine-specific)
LPDHKQWDDSPPDQDYFIELFRTSKNQIIWGGNYFDLVPSRGFIVWDKGPTMKGRDFAEAELAWSSFDRVIRIWVGSPNNKTRIHACQKPVILYQWLLKNYAKPGNLILDTHVGSASSLIACEEMGFEYIGCELDKDYYDAACKRLEQYRQQLRMF